MEDLHGQQGQGLVGDGNFCTSTNLLSFSTAMGYPLFMRKRQLELNLPKPKRVFGGSLLKGNPRTKRPVATKLPIHLVLRSEKSQMRLLKTLVTVDQRVYCTCKKHGVRLYEYANVGNHLHLVIKLPKPWSWAPFIRELTGRIAQEIGLKWKWRPYTRIADWGKAYNTLLDYVRLNQFEADGFINRREIKNLTALRAIFDGS